MRRLPPLPTMPPMPDLERDRRLSWRMMIARITSECVQAAVMGEDAPSSMLERIDDGIQRRLPRWGKEETTYAVALNDWLQIALDRNWNGMVLKPQDKSELGQQRELEDGRKLFVLLDSDDGDGTLIAAKTKEAAVRIVLGERIESLDMNEEEMEKFLADIEAGGERDAMVDLRPIYGVDANQWDDVTKYDGPMGRFWAFPYEFRSYDVLQRKNRDTDAWMDFSTLRSPEDAKRACELVDTRQWEGDTYEFRIVGTRPETGQYSRDTVVYGDAE